MLSAEQIRQFKNEGYVVIRGLIDASTVQAWRGRLIELGHKTKPGEFQPEAEATWPRPWRSVPDFMLPLHEQPRVATIVDQLGDGAFRPHFGDPANAYGANVLMTYSDDPIYGEEHELAARKEAWTTNFLSRTGHVDGYGAPEKTATPMTTASNIYRNVDTGR